MNDTFELDNSKEINPFDVSPAQWFALVGALVMAYGLEEIFLSDVVLADIQGHPISLNQWTDGSIKITVHPSIETQPS